MPTTDAFDDAITFARDLIRIPSPSGGEEEVARRVRDEFQALGYEEVWTDTWGNVVGVVRGRGQAPPVLLNCHMDVVAEGEAEEWEHPPFGGVVDGGFLHGRGAMDIKGPLALQTHAAALLAGEAPGDVIVAHTVFEERGGYGMQRLLEEGEVEPGAVIIGEATHGDVAIGHRGRSELEVVIRGLAGHASAPERARNALDLVGPVLRAIRDLSVRQEGDPVLGRATVVATDVRARPETANVIPDEAVVVVDWRILPSDTPKSLVARLEEAVFEAVGDVPQGFEVQVRIARETQTTYTGETEDRPLFSPGFLMEEDGPLVEAAARAVGRRDDPGTPAVVRPWTFATDGGWSCGVMGIPTVGFAPGEERYAHTNRERLDLDEARWAFERYPELIVALQNAME